MCADFPDGFAGSMPGRSILAEGQSRKRINDQVTLNASVGGYMCEYTIPTGYRFFVGFINISVGESGRSYFELRRISGADEFVELHGIFDWIYKSNFNDLASISYNAGETIRIYVLNQLPTQEIFLGTIWGTLQKV